MSRTGFSLWSTNSFCSIASAGSSFSIGSIGSFASIGSVGSALSAFSCVLASKRRDYSSAATPVRGSRATPRGGGGGRRR
jgi:hypothetical protein